MNNILGLNIYPHYLYWTGEVDHSDVILSAMASQITDISIVCPVISSGADQRKHQSSDGFPSQRASNMENVSIWWRHHMHDCHKPLKQPITLWTWSTRNASKSHKLQQFARVLENYLSTNISDKSVLNHVLSLFNSLYHKPISNRQMYIIYMILKIHIYILMGICVQKQNGCHFLTIFSSAFFLIFDLE